MPSKPILVAALAIGACAWCLQVTAQQPAAGQKAATRAKARPQNDTSPNSPFLPTLATKVERLEAHLTSIESIRAIKRLQYAYGHYVELGLWNDFADLFTDDAVTNYQQGVRGKAQVRQLFFDQVGQGKLGLGEGRIYPHILFQPVITLAPDGRTAKGRWRILAMLGGYGGSSATWYSGVYENEYVHEGAGKDDGGVWKISVLRSDPKVTAAYNAAGWKDSGTHVPFHYTAADVTAPISPATNTTPASNTAPSLKSLADRVNDLAHRAELLNDQAAVTNVLDTYGYAMDGKLWDQAANLFANNGTLELGLQGVYVGKTSIRHALDQFGPQRLDNGKVRDGQLRNRQLNDHVYLQTLVSVSPDGRTANARGVELIMSNSSGSVASSAELTEGTFENTFIKLNGTWKIQSMHFYPRMIVDAATGWAKSAKPAPGPSKEFPPDRPPTASYEIYPKFAVAPFHFNNPATGNAPQYPAGVLPAPKPITSATPAAVAPTIRNTADLEARLTELERSLTAAEAYDAAENLIGAYGYYLDESPSALAGLFVKGAKDAAEGHSLANPGSTIFVNQALQPVIDVAPDGKSAKVHARLLDLGGTSGAAGYWTAGTLEGQIALEDGAWIFKPARSYSRWSAPYPGGWAHLP